VVVFSGEFPRNIDEYLRVLRLKQFVVREAGLSIRGVNPVFAILSTGDLRAVDPALRRQAIVLYMSPPTEAQLVEMACRATAMDPELIKTVIQEGLRLQHVSDRNEPLTSRTILDALAAVNAMRMTTGADSPDLRMLLELLIPR